ncbi:glycerophosphodiester phosphodiesterase [Zafaria sp. Z1313]|uniref:glycerophosphodiester phosphodiesterase n=1 Tax=unclassified Zafaria TaxID=2828765 RepID=UPI002E75A940|nr:glycerophosphodiester phosphodiesterase [Zafaria sp. J156]MEE1621437.1 glycerophosphodiester phosphodiesterase [Zafaria sp. J156]
MNAPVPRGVPYLHRSLPGSARGPLAFAHRGFAPDGAENTMAAFRAAVELGFRYLELDVRTSRDGVLMVFHDETLERTTDGSGRLGDHTAAELGAFRVAGTEPIPTFEELLAAWPDVHLNVDLKDAAGAEPMARLIEQYGARDRVLVASFSDARRRAVQRRVPGPLAASPGAPLVAAFTLLSALGLQRLLRPWLRGVVALQVPERSGRLPLVTPRFLAHAHSEGLHVHVWVVDEPGDMRRLIDLGVDGIMTDRADLLAGVLAERGAWPQR